MKLKSFTLLLLPLSLALTAHAEPQSVDETSKNVISFGTEVSKEVDYDVMAVTLFIKEEKIPLAQAFGWGESLGDFRVN